MIKPLTFFRHTLAQNGLALEMPVGFAIDAAPLWRRGVPGRRARRRSGGPRPTRIEPMPYRHFQARRSIATLTLSTATPTQRRITMRADALGFMTIVGLSLLLLPVLVEPNPRAAAQLARETSPHRPMIFDRRWVRAPGRGHAPRGQRAGACRAALTLPQLAAASSGSGARAAPWPSQRWALASRTKAPTAGACGRPRTVTRFTVR